MSPQAPGGRTRLAAIVGSPVAHSLSPAMHNAAFEALGLDWRYEHLPVAPEDFDAAWNLMGVMKA